jgi:hypothetical protein
MNMASPITTIGETCVLYFVYDVCGDVVDRHSDSMMVFSVDVPPRSTTPRLEATVAPMTAMMARLFSVGPRSTTIASLLQASVREYGTLHQAYPPSDPRMREGPPGLRAVSET